MAINMYGGRFDDLYIYPMYCPGWAASLIPKSLLEGFPFKFPVEFNVLIYSKYASRALKSKAAALGHTNINFNPLTFNDRD